MNQTSLEKIQAASTFLRYFRRCLPDNIQTIVRPYLDQPYQLALNILDCCEDSTCCTTDAISQRLNISKSSVRQVLCALREEGLVFMASTSKGWFPLDALESEPYVAVSEMPPPLASVQSGHWP